MWTEEFVAFVKKHTIPVAVDARKEARRKDAVGEFVRKTRCVTFTAAGRLVLITADGRLLGQLWYGNIPGENERLRMQSLRRAWEKWLALPEHVRRPGGIQIDGEPVSPAQRREVLPPVPSGALVVRVYNRHLEPDGKGGYRYTRPEDYLKEKRKNAPRYREVAQDFMWIPEQEWRAMVAQASEVGQSYPAPRSFRARVFRFHLDPARGLGEEVMFNSHNDAESGTLVITVEEVSPETVRLRLEGQAVLNCKGPKKTSYRPHLLGYLVYDRKSESVHSFRMVALGLVERTPYGARPNNRPLGIAFEYVPDPKPWEQIPPRGARDNLDGYLKAVRR